MGDASDEFPRPYGKYELLERLGEGGMAEAFRARMGGVAGFEKIVVIRRILPELARDQRSLKMFVDEAKLVARIQHQNIVQVFDLGQLESGELYMAMEYVPGTNLAALMHEATTNDIRAPIWFYVHVLAEVLGGLSFAHELFDDDGQPAPVIHRDVTPSNVILSVNGQVKLTDFGIAMSPSSIEGPDSKVLKGKVAYMSPELLQGNELDPRADVFSAGVVLWECLAGRPLFDRESDFDTMLAITQAERPAPSMFNAMVPPELDRVVLTALEPNPDARFITARHFQASLLELLRFLRPDLLPEDVRHVVNVLMGREDPNPSFSDAREHVPLPSAPPDMAFGFAASIPPMAPAIPGLTPASLMGTPLPILTPLPALGSSGLEDGAMSSTPGPPIDRDAYPAELVSGDLPEEPVASSASGIPELTTAQMDRDVIAQLIAQGGRPSVAPKPSSYHGPYPFFVRTETGQVEGPLSYDGMFDRCRSLDEPIDAISVDGQAWRDRRAFALLTGLSALLPIEPMAPQLAFSGRLGTTSVLSLLGMLGLHGSSGRLVLISADGRGRREIDTLYGRPTLVLTGTMNLQAPAILVKSGLLSPDLIPQYVHESAARGVEIETLVAQARSTQADLVHSLLLRDALAESLRWDEGSYAFDAQAHPRCTNPGARDLARLLRDTIARAFSLEMLREKLEPKLGLSFEASSQLAPVTAQLGLDAPTQMGVTRLIAGERLGSVIDDFPAEHVHGFIILAYLLIECGLLQLLQV